MSLLRETTDGGTVHDLSFESGEAATTDAFLVTPAAVAEPGPAIVFFHWLEGGSPTSNRTEFLDEARGLAARGVTSLLVDGRFPWHERPTSIEHDVAAVQADGEMVRRGIDLLAARPEVDPERMALVGHDFGAMYEVAAFAADPSLRGLVMMAPTARWSDWFLQYWPIADPADAYRAAMAPLDPVTWLPRTTGRPVLLQFGSQDEYVPRDVADEITAAAGPAARAVTYEAGHQLDERARVDREAWLAEVLAISD